MTSSPLTAFHRANALTYGSLLSAVAAIAAAHGGSAPAAGALIALSVIADTFDGRFARSFARSPAERDLGVELDSLSDAIAFGAAPCICMMLLMPPSFGGTWLMWCLTFAAFAACAITRLAFYNVTQGELHDFVGLPAPVAALVWSTTLLLQPSALTSGVVMLACAVAMVSPLRIPRPAGLGLAAFAAWPLLVGLAHLLGSLGSRFQVLGSGF
jgi:CDP-diacylglycerol--serine O-phosphatidyltransferase